MRIVVDTNVFVSAALKTLSLPAIAAQAAVKYGRLLKSTATENELLAVFNRPKIAVLVDPVFMQWVTRSMAQAETIECVQHVKLCRDSQDDKFLDLALNGAADFIITGDADLLALNPFHGIQIIPPAIFVMAKKV